MVSLALEDTRGECKQSVADVQDTATLANKKTILRRVFPDELLKENQITCIFEQNKIKIKM